LGGNQGISNSRNQVFLIRSRLVNPGQQWNKNSLGHFFGSELEKSEEKCKLKDLGQIRLTQWTSVSSPVRNGELLTVFTPFIQPSRMTSKANNELAFI
jgi:hypothetical protein